MPSVGDKKYLFIADIEKNRDLAEKVTWGFRRKAFMTNTILFFATDMENKTNRDYFRIFPCIDPQRFCNIQVVPKNVELVLKLLDQVDYYIVSNIPDEAFYIFYAHAKKVKIVENVGSEEDIFTDIQTSPAMEELKQNFEYAIIKNFFKTYPLDEYEYFLMHNGLGEALRYFYWLREYRKISNKKILTLCVNNAHADLMKLCPYVEETLQIDWNIFECISIFASREYGIRNFYTVHVDPNVLKIADKYPDNHDFGRDFLNIDPEIKKFELFNIDIPRAVVANVKKKFKEMNLSKGKTVFFIIESISYNQPYLLNFWARLAQCLKVAGYDVVVNGNKELIPNCKHVFLSLPETVTFIGLCKHCVGIPTGFLEAICSLNYKDIINFQGIGDEDFMSPFVHENVEITMYQRTSTNAFAPEDDQIIKQMFDKITSRRRKVRE